MGVIDPRGANGAALIYSSHSKTRMREAATSSDSVSAYRTEGERLKLFPILNACAVFDSQNTAPPFLSFLTHRHRYSALITLYLSVMDLCNTS